MDDLIDMLRDNAEVEAYGVFAADARLGVTASCGGA
jgi:hypothetical protein